MENRQASQNEKIVVTAAVVVEKLVVEEVVVTAVVVMAVNLLLGDRGGGLIPLGCGGGLCTPSP